MSFSKYIMHRGARWNEARAMSGVTITDDAVRAALVEKGVLPRDAGANYIVPVKLVPQDKETPANAIPIPFLSWNKDDGTKAPVFGVPVKVQGWSMTNVAYLANGRTFMAMDGRAYLQQKR